MLKQLQIIIGAWAGAGAATCSDRITVHCILAEGVVAGS